jgi:hypothetical protein
LPFTGPWVAASKLRITLAHCSTKIYQSDGKKGVDWAL